MPDRPARGGVTQRISHRPGREPLELIDEITARLGLDVMPLTWPVGIASEFHGLLARTTGDYLKLTRTPGGATIAQEDRLTPAHAFAEQPQAWPVTVEEHELLTETGMNFDEQAYPGRAGRPRCCSGPPC